MSDWRDQLAAGVSALAGDAAPGTAGRLADYIALLQKWNRAYNLTAQDEAAGIVTHHVLDSLSVLRWLQGERIADVGTGAGLPGLVLAIADPARTYTLIDSNAKKTGFCAYVVDTLGVHSVEVVHVRSEHYRPQPGFDTVVSRAFADTGTFLRQAGHLCAGGGRMLAMKGKHPAAELERLPAGWCVESVHPLDVPGLDAVRHLVMVKRD